MPIYEYKCGKCGAEFEKLVRNSEEKVACEECSSGSVERKLSVFSASVASPSCSMQGACPSAGTHSCSSGCPCAHS